MPRYDIQCPTHGVVEAYGTPQQGIDHQVRCEACGTVEAKRIYNVPYEISDNTFPGAGRVSEQLSPNGTPIQINTRRDERVLMEMAGVRHYERGEYAQNKAKEAKETSDRKAARRDDGIRRLYYAKNHPNSTQR